MWRFDTIRLENADDEEIANGFENQDGWTSIVSEANDLYNDVDNLSNGDAPDDWNEEDIQMLSNMIGNNEVCENIYMPDDSDGGVTLVIKNENGDEIETIDCSDIMSFGTEQGCDLWLEEFEGEDEYELVKSYFEKNGKDPDFCHHVFPMPGKGEWYWLNVLCCDFSDGCPTYKVEVMGEFDSSKLAVVRSLVEESLNGMMGIDVITDILYDGKSVEGEEYGIPDCVDSATNFFIKNDDGVNPEKVYDMTNHEEG